MKIKTETLKNLVNLAFKGCSNNKLIPITGLMLVKFKDNTLSLHTTDGINHVCIKYAVNMDSINDSLYAVIDANMFVKLVNKLTTDYTEITVEDAYMLVKANGSYKIELPLDEEGNPIQFKYPAPDIKDKDCTIDIDTFKRIKAINDASRAITLESPCLTGYMFADDVMTSDNYKICTLSEKPFTTQMLLSAEAVNLIASIPEKSADCYFDNDTIVIISDTMTIITYIMDGQEDFPVDAINDFVHNNFENSVVVNKQKVLNVLDRLSLFVTPYDNNGAVFTFKNDGIHINSKKNSGQEVIPYKDGQFDGEFTCTIDIEMLKSQMQANESDNVTVEFGDSTALKMVDGDITQICSLMED